MNIFVWYGYAVCVCASSLDDFVEEKISGIVMPEGLPHTHHTLNTVVHWTIFI